MKKTENSPLTFIMNLKAYYRLLLTSVLVLVSDTVFGQTPGYVQQDVVKIQGVTSDANSQIDNLSITLKQKETSVQYYDGLGRTVQTIAEQSSPLQHDMLQPVAYDNLGRQTKSYLPYTDENASTGTGTYRPNALTTDQAAFYNNTAQYLVPVDGAPYNTAVFENSPLQRMLNAGMTGYGFQPGVTNNHYKTISYRSNTSADGNIPIWNPDGTVSGNNYAVNSLSVTDGVDEAGSETLVFTDLAGHTILKRQKMGSNNVDTYYLYNNAGMVSYILPPAAVALMAGSGNYNANQTGAVSTSIFIFRYDNMGRLVQKTVPGKGIMSIVYDPLNRPVLVQDANLNSMNEWNYLRYDAQGRVISQGIYTDINNLGWSAMQTFVSGLASTYQTTWYETRNTSLSTGYYTANVFPTAATGTLTPLSFAYFDNYTLTTGTTYTYSQVISGINVTTAAVKGMPTMVRSVPTGAGVTASQVLVKVTFYDKRLNPIQVKSNNELYYTGSNLVTDISSVAPDFTGVPQETIVSKQSAASTTTTVQTNLSYDQVNRLTGVSQAYNGGTLTSVAAYSYSEAGQVIKKSLGYVNSTTWLQNVDMRYNIRGQLLYINNSTLTDDNGATNSDTNDVFGMAFSYDQAAPNSLGNTPCYNGDLSAVRWMSLYSNGSATNERAYNYTYDQLNRYTSAAYTERIVTSTNFGTNAAAYNETITYNSDNSGNILTLNRNGPVPAGSTTTFGPIDQLSYTYKTTTIPNQLSTVTDGSADSLGFNNRTGLSTAYVYDVNGNLTNDYYKGLQLYYNVLNRTSKITITTATNTWIDYTYDASGNVIRKRQYDNNAATPAYTTDYIDGFVYINGTLSYFPMPEGRVVNTSGTFTQEFIITDQQGNARASFNNSGTGGTAKVVQENSYYGTGLAITPLETGDNNKKLYNGGSEWQNDYNKLPDYYQAFYRNYDAATARFVGVDPEAESAESMTTYQYAGNNPIMGNDPMGNINPRLPQPPPVVSGELSGMDAIAAENQGAEDAEAWLNYNSGSDAASMGSGLANGGANQGYMAGSYVNNIGRNTNPANWQNVGAFDDDGAYSVDGGAAQDAFYQGLDPGQSYHYQTYEYYDNGSETHNNPTGINNSTLLDQVDIRLITGQYLVADDANQGGDPTYPRGAIGGPMPYYGNFVGPGPDGPKANPYQLIGYNHQILKPIDMIDAAAQRHDYAYWKLGASGVSSALWDDRTGYADRALAGSAQSIVEMYNNGINDSITNSPISLSEYQEAQKIEISFGILGGLKSIGNLLGR